MLGSLLSLAAGVTRPKATTDWRTVSPPCLGMDDPAGCTQVHSKGLLNLDPEDRLRVGWSWRLCKNAMFCTSWSQLAWNRKLMALMLTLSSIYDRKSSGSYERYYFLVLFSFQHS